MYTNDCLDEVEHAALQLRHIALGAQARRRRLYSYRYLQSANRDRQFHFLEIAALTGALLLMGVGQLF